MKKDNKKPNNKLEQSITDYFKKAELKVGPENEDPGNTVFEQEKVYANVLDIIKRKQRKNTLGQILKIAASVLVFISVSLFIYYNRQTHYAGQVAMAEAVAPRGRIINVSLPDGTTVCLNAGSSLSYPKSFTAGVREVTLKGEGYFKVMHNPGRPFIIHTGKINTQVLGTSFNIDAYAGNEDIKVTVLTGKVGVYMPDGHTGKNNTRFITANQQVVFNKAADSLNNVQTVPNADELIAWSEGRMIFNNQLLAHVIADVERHYNVSIKTPDSLKNCRITVDFGKAGLQKVLYVLAQLVNGGVKYQNGVYVLDGKGC